MRAGNRAKIMFMMNKVDDNMKFKGMIVDIKKQIKLEQKTNDIDRFKSAL